MGVFLLSVVGDVFPFEDFINWENTIIPIEQTFNWSDTKLLHQRLLENDVLLRVYKGDICKWHEHLRNLWKVHFLNETVQIEWIVKSLEI